VLLVVGVFRGIVVATGEVWLAYLITGGSFVLLGAFCWSFRTRRSAPGGTG
jgi:hypothetical protein